MISSLGAVRVSHALHLALRLSTLPSPIDTGKVQAQWLFQEVVPLPRITRNLEPTETRGLVCCRSTTVKPHETKRNVLETHQQSRNNSFVDLAIR